MAFVKAPDDNLYLQTSFGNYQKQTATKCRLYMAERLKSDYRLARIFLKGIRVIKLMLL